MKSISELIADEVITGDDGYKMYWPKPNKGGFDALTLRGIADELDRLNAKWDADVNKFFNHPSAPSVQPVRAWAVVDKDGRMERQLFLSKLTAEHGIEELMTYFSAAAPFRVIRVEIREVNDE